MNKRYQNASRSDEPSGSTRKSAASAKIKRESPSKAKTSKAKPQTRREKFMAKARADQAKTKTTSKSSTKREAPIMPDTPEYKRWRRIWWVLILCAVVALVPSLILNANKKYSQTPPWNYISMGLTVVAVILVVATWVLDFKKIRPITRQAQLEARKEQDSKKKK